MVPMACQTLILLGALRKLTADQINELKKVGITLNSIATGDFFDKNTVYQFPHFDPTRETDIVITINGVRTKRKDAEAMRDSVTAFNKVPATSRVAAWNGTHWAGLGDFIQVLGEEFNLVDDIAVVTLKRQIEVAATVLKKVDPVRRPKIVVLAHSQGTEMFLRAAEQLKEEKQFETLKLIQFFGHGGETFVPGKDLGLDIAANFYRPGDKIAANNFKGFASRKKVLELTAKGYSDYKVYRLPKSA
jgi:hypothetical protein